MGRMEESLGENLFQCSWLQTYLCHLKQIYGQWGSHQVSTATQGSSWVQPLVNSSHLSRTHGAPGSENRPVPSVKGVAVITPTSQRNILTFQVVVAHKQLLLS